MFAISIAFEGGSLRFRFEGDVHPRTGLEAYVAAVFIPQSVVDGYFLDTDDLPLSQ
jgi:hypothetical protein